MSVVSCRFCSHRNPAGARFCNACGSPLDLKPCPGCEAINEAHADRCHQCGAPLAAEDRREVEPAAAPFADATIEVPKGADMPSPATRMTRPPGSSEPLHNIPVALADRLDAEPNPAHHRSRERARGHTALRRVLAGTAFVAVAAGSYYAYRATTSEGPGNDVTDVATTRIEDAAPATPSGAARGADPATGPATPGFGITERAPDPLPESSRAPSADAPATPPRPDGGIRPRPNANRSTGETPSTLAREGRAEAAAPSPRTQAQIDRDALETKRLIARDLAGFMPPGGAQDAPRSPSAR